MASVKMLGYSVQEMSYKFNTDLAGTQGTKNFQISPKIRVDMRRNDKNMNIVCTVTIDKHQPTMTPFELNAIIGGSFLIKDETADLETLRIEASNMLFPYVRAFIAQVTSATNMPAYHLPIIDFADVKPNSEQTAGGAPQASGGKNIVIRPLDELE